MEKLEDLPIKPDSQHSPEEQDIMNRYFDEPQTKEEESLIERMHLKRVGLTALLFVLLGGGFLDSILTKIPYISEGMVVLGLKTLIFMIGMMFINWLV